MLFRSADALGLGPEATFFVFKILFIIFGCVGSSFLCEGFLQLQRAGAALHYGAQASHCGGFSCCRAQALGTRALVVAACGLSSCGTQALEHAGSVAVARRL